MAIQDLDLLTYVQKDTVIRRVSSHRGGEYHGPCPVCGGKDRFRVQPARDFWICRQCEESGDLIAYLVFTQRLTRLEAYQARHGDAPHLAALASSAQPARSAQVPEAATPPNAIWQGRAWDFVAEAQAALWAGSDARALAWLQGRGLTAETIQQAGLGFNPAERWESYAAWGLPEELRRDGKPKRIWLPRGIVIPWVIGADLWRVNIRRAPSVLADTARHNAAVEARYQAGEIGKTQRDTLLRNDAKYIGPAGCGNGLYNADVLGQLPAMLVEGEIDALTIEQEAGDLIAPCATGSTGGARRARWAALLALSPLVLVTFDADVAGDKTRRYWLDSLPNGRYWRPLWGDVNTMFRGGANLRAWLAAGLACSASVDRRARNCAPLVPDSPEISGADTRKRLDAALGGFQP